MPATVPLRAPVPGADVRACSGPLRRHSGHHGEVGNRYRSRQGHELVRNWCERRLDEWTVAHERHEVDTGAGRTHLVVAGSGEVIVLLLPGTNFNAATSLSLASALAARVRVVLADLPGQPGLSTGHLPGGGSPRRLWHVGRRGRRVGAELPGGRTPDPRRALARWRGSRWPRPRPGSRRSS